MATLLKRILFRDGTVVWSVPYPLKQ